MKDANMLFKVICPVLCLSAFSCSVKEPRGGSPCLLYEDPGAMTPVCLALWCGDTIVAEGTAESDGVIEFEIPRGPVLVTAVNRTAHSSCPDGILSISDRVPVDSIYADSHAVDCTGEWARDTVSVRKQFASVSVSADMEKWYGESPASMEIISFWSGLDLRSMRAVPGTYGCIYPYTGGTLTFRILRQGDDSLVLRLADGAGRVMDDVPLGLVLARAGYLWTEDSLPDVSVNIIGTGLNLRIVVSGWKRGDSVEVDI